MQQQQQQVAAKAEMSEKLSSPVEEGSVPQVL